MAKQKPSGWLDKYTSNVPETFGKGVAASDVTQVNKQLTPTNAKKVTQEELDAREVQARRDRIATANAAKSKQFDSPKDFATATSAIADKLRLSENPNIFDDYLNLGPLFGHMASGLGEVPLNIQEGNYGQAALNVATPLVAGAAETLLSPIISKGLKSGRKAIDQNFTKVGRQLADIEKKGIAKGLSPHEIKMQQMDQVGITSAQREAYVPGVSDLLYKYVRPQGYTGMGGESKFSEILSNIKKGGVEYSKHSTFEDYMTLENLDRSTILPPREDSWLLYLGKPQKHGTFEMSQTAPIQHPAYTPEQLSNLDLYSIKNSFGKRGLFPGYSEIDGNFDNFDVSSFNNVIPYLKNPINIEKSNIIMGGHNKRLSRAGLEYNDIWDLNPTVAPINFLPSKLKPKFSDNPFFVNKDSRGVESLREIAIPIDKFIGKPFMTHGVEQKLTSDKVVKDVKNSLLKYLDEIPVERQKELTNIKSFETPEEINNLWDTETTIINDNLKILKKYPKFKDGGWLNKYNDGGPVQENYNDYSVSAPEGFQGDGYSDVGRDYSPAWGGQFADGGKAKKQPIVVTDKNDPRLRAYRDSLRLYNKYQQDLKDRGGKEVERSFNPNDDLLGSLKDNYTKNKIKPTRVDWYRDGYEDHGNAFIPVYKKPTQPVVYQERVYQTETPEMQDLQMGMPVDIPLPELHRQQGPNRITMGKPLFPGGPQTDYYTPIDEAGNVVPTSNWNQKFVMGGSMPGAVGFMYARTNDPAPSNGPYAKKTKASAENGAEMRFYQDGLDWKPKTISKDGSQLTKLDQLTNFTNYNTKQPGGWLDNYE